MAETPQEKVKEASGQPGQKGTPNEDGSSTTESLTPAQYLAIPPDGGWGWVIVFASFIINGLVDGLAAMFGVFQPEFLKYFGASRGKTALAGSLMAGSFMISGPVVSGLVNTYGCRIVTIVGSIIAALAYVLATLSPNMDVLIVTYGVLAGIGVGMFYLPAMVMVSFYFERRRALATGIACSGAGFGMVVLAPVSAALLSVLTWQNSLYVISAITLIAAVLGIFMRPLKAPEITPETSEGFAEPLMDKTSHEDLHDDLIPNGNVNADLGEHRTCDNLQGSTRSDALRKSLSHHQSISSAFSQESSPFFLNKPGLNTGDPKVNTRVVYDRSKRDQYFSTPVITTPYRYSESEHDDKDTANPNYLQKKSVRHRHASKSCHNLASQNHPKSVARGKLIEEMNRPLNRLDIFYSSSILTVPEFRNNDDADLVSVLEKMTVIPEESLQESSSSCCKCIPRPTKNALKQMLDCSILLDSSFLIICLASAFIQVAYFIPVVFITEYAETFGVGKGQAASLVSIIGGCNGIGRALHGALANHPKVSVLHLNNWTLIVAGISTVLCPVFCSSYATLIVYSAIFGFFVAGFPPLANLLLVEYLGIAKLSNAFGLLSMVRGLATCAGAPIAGVLREATESFACTFYFAGSLFVMAGLIHYLLPLVTRCQEKKVGNCIQAEDMD